MLGGEKKKNKFEIVLVVRDKEGKSTGKKKSFSSDSSDKISGFLQKSSINKKRGKRGKSRKKGNVQNKKSN
tara:strand:+ start:215 stop:427 length:213 start_codon:yes stop_codon:yes gene_type:complete